MEDCNAKSLTHGHQNQLAVTTFRCLLCSYSVAVSLHFIDSSILLGESFDWAESDRLELPDRLGAITSFTSETNQFQDLVSMHAVSRSYIIVNAVPNSMKLCARN